MILKQSISESGFHKAIELNEHKTPYASAKITPLREPVDWLGEHAAARETSVPAKLEFSVSKDRRNTSNLYGLTIPGVAVLDFEVPFKPWGKKSMSRLIYQKFPGALDWFAPV